MTNASFTLAQLAEKLGGTVVGDADTVITGINTLQDAESGQISFLANPVYQKYLASTKASAVILDEKQAKEAPCAALVHSNPYLAYAQLSHLWDWQFAAERGSKHPSASIAATATVAESATIEAGAVIQDEAVIEDGAWIGANAVVGQHSRIGRGTKLHAQVAVYHGVSIGERCIIHSGAVIGSDGFGFAPAGGEWHKIAQIGGVVIEDEVEVGANTAIDRGALDNTVIERGVKLDNHIQIAHNVRVGAFTAMAAGCKIAGSTTIGKHCIFGGGSGVAGHLTVTDNVHLTAMTMVIKSLNEPGVYSSGTGVQTNAKWRKSIARLRQLDQLVGRVKQLEKSLKQQQESS
ncbi:MAG: UDP-3-O-(3-hydroxymyristoyl)glucosamine N-acyltransferase [Oleiphilaceae bacterium]|nr:UDP-3-O-(3-hydroxymyristoyl)glucosamine N-acyltransferase [Oleiphilaceae bacterium]